MDAVSTASLYQTALYNIMNAQKNEAVATAQAGSEKVATDLDGYGGSAQNLVATNSLQARITGYLANAQVVSDKLTVQTQALQQVANAAQSSGSAIQLAIANGNGSGLLASLQSAFGATASALNTNYNGQYIFAGGQTATQPFPTASLSALAASPVASQFQNDQTATTTRLNDDTVVTTGFLASNVGQPVLTALQAIQQYDAGPNGPLTGNLNSTQTAYLQSVLSQFTASTTAATAVVAESGEVQTQVSDAQTALGDQQSALTGIVTNLTVPDEGQVATNLTLAQTALQASAQVFTSLQNDSLLTLLSSTD